MSAILVEFPDHFQAQVGGLDKILRGVMNRSPAESDKVAIITV